MFFSSTLLPSPSSHSPLLVRPVHSLHPHLQCRRRRLLLLLLKRHGPPARLRSAPMASSSPRYEPDELPVGDDVVETLLNNHTTDEKAEAEARRQSWIERGWAPWEEILTPEGKFARTSLDEGEEVPLQNPEAIEAFRMLRPSYRRKKMEESGLSEEEWYLQQFRTKSEIPDPIQTIWSDRMVLRLVPPRDWPPRGWKVDPKELAFIREAHRMQCERVDVHGEVNSNVDGMSLERYKVFLKQYKEWVAANRDRLEQESYKYDQDYYPGRRKRGKDYKEDMLELPFFYPGQICFGKVTTLHLHQGAFVDIGCVHDGWVPIAGNDWYWIRHHIKIEMPVVVEVLAKRDPYRFRFPIELRFVDPNIDHLIFNKFDFPPIFHREEDKNPEELWRSAGRAPIPRERPSEEMEEQPLLSDHPYVDKLWQLHNAEQMILDYEDENPETSKQAIEEMLNDDFDEENNIEYTEAYYKKALIPKVIVKINPRELDLDAARAEREVIKSRKAEAAERGEDYKSMKLRRNIEMDEYDFMHWRRSLEEREALMRDISCRTTLGLPLDEPGRYAHDVTKNRYDPNKPLYRYDYFGEPKKNREVQTAKISRGAQQVNCLEW